MRNVIQGNSAHSAYWGCSDCAWLFNPTGPPKGDSLVEMMKNFERQRDQEFASHVCAQHPKARGASGKIKPTRKSGDRP